MNKNNNNDKILYKYRSLNNILYLIDIIINERLYAAKYTELNDPMEGGYIADPSNRNLIHSLRMEKDKTRVLSLSNNKNNILMWSHYADSHKGCCLIVKLRPTSTLTLENVNYLESLPELSGAVNGEKLLSHKLKLWEYESEARVFTKNTYVKVNVIGVIFGEKVSQKDINFHLKWMNRLNPGLEFYKCTRDNLLNEQSEYEKIYPQL